VAPRVQAAVLFFAKGWGFFSLGGCNSFSLPFFSFDEEIQRNSPYLAASFRIKLPHAPPPLKVNVPSSPEWWHDAGVFTESKRPSLIGPSPGGYWPNHLFLPSPFFFFEESGRRGPGIRWSFFRPESSSAEQTGKARAFPVGFGVLFPVSHLQIYSACVCPFLIK